MVSTGVLKVGVVLAPSTTVNESEVMRPRKWRGSSSSVGTPVNTISST
jgi:hypothetical protein